MTNTKTDTNKTNENIWMNNPVWEAMNSSTPDTYKDYYSRWMDAVDAYTGHVKSFQQSLMEKTTQAWDESYKMAREGLDRGTELFNSVHEMTAKGMETFRKQL